jgi:hypothetical protein
MSESKKSRREFLGIAGATLASVAIASSTLMLPTAVANSITASRGASLEAWLLTTGQQELDPQLYSLVQQSIAG